MAEQFKLQAGLSNKNCHQTWKNVVYSFRPLRQISELDERMREIDDLLKIYGAVRVRVDSNYELIFEREEDMLLFLLKWS